MYRVIALVLMAYAICFPPLAQQAEAGLKAIQQAPTRAERMMSDLRDFVGRPLEKILAALARPRGPGAG